MAQTIPKKAFTAIEAVLYVACQSGPRPVRSKEICDYQGVKHRYLEHIMQRLVHEGVLRGVRGPRGGYLLAKDRRKIKLSDIYKAIELMEASVDRQLHSPLHKKVMEPLWSGIRRSIVQQLRDMTIQDLCDNATAVGLDVAKSKKTDFNI